MTEQHEETEMTTTAAPFKIRVPLGNATFRAETPWARDLNVSPNGMTATATLDNTCFFAPLGVGDVVRLEADRHGDWNVTGLVARNPQARSYLIYLMTTAELQAEQFPSSDTSRARWQAFETDLNARADRDGLSIEGAFGVAPLAAVTFTGTDPAEINRFEETIDELAATHPITVFGHTHPDDLNDPDAMQELGAALAAIEED